MRPDIHIHFFKRSNGSKRLFCVDTQIPSTAKTTPQPTQPTTLINEVIVAGDYDMKKYPIKRAARAARGSALSQQHLCAVIGRH